MSAEAEIALRRAAGTVAKVADRNANEWRGNLTASRTWTRGYIEGMQHAQRLIAELADNEAARA